MEWKIGEIRQINNEWYQCIEGCFCRNCDLEKSDKYLNSYDCLNNECRSEKRKDNRPVIFRKLEKVGEPYMLEDKKFQKYKVFKTPYIYNKIDCSWQSFADPYYVSLEIKPISEDMEENKLNLKPFDIQKAKEGKPVCTRDGREARIICWDSKGDECSLIVAVKSKTDEILEEVITYDKNGMHPANDESSPDNLMMDLEKRKLYVNIYKNKDGIYVSRVRDNSDIETLNLASSFLIGTICVTLEDNEIIGCNKSV